MPKKAVAKTPAKKAAKTPAPAKEAKPPAKKAARAEPPADKEPAPPAKKAAAKPPVQRTRIVVPMDFYEPHKEEVKGVLKERGLKWTFLGQGKGLYKREDGGVHCFTQFQDDGVHYSLWGEDKEAVAAILAAWRALLGEARWKEATASGQEAVAAEKAQEESEAMRLWRMAEPQPRPGEPDLFFRKRKAEWEAKRPA